MQNCAAQTQPRLGKEGLKIGLKIVAFRDCNNIS